MHEKALTYSSYLALDDLLGAQHPRSEEHDELDAYRDEGEASQVCEALVDIDEGLQEWRYRHVKMVERTIGDLAGTGGSSGVAYLRGTLFRPLYPELWEIRSRM